ncbi:ArdC-like ssDNA-binding domain-containing protein [Erythrobacter sp. AP23]|uniref:ArdC-like ssDNA-binding domain-containing protein n=1 Tax=Erythrobacter sp. AP23 TaxID=499656 RepID=UPI00076CEECC|nr:hypothetical protein ASS64_14415 [Erythrobacter sp. AP23]
MSVNPISGRRYSGINVLSLWVAVIEGGYASQRWLNYRQAVAAGGHVRNGERGTTVCYADRFTPRAEAEQAQDAGLLGLEAMGIGHTKAAQIILIDMNAVEDEVVELVSAVTARMIFRQPRRAEPRNRFPVHLLLEEAHRFVASTPSKYTMDAGRTMTLSKSGARC